MRQISLYGNQISKLEFADDGILVAVLDPIGYEERYNRRIPGFAVGVGRGEILRLGKGTVNGFMMKDADSPPKGMKYNLLSTPDSRYMTHSLLLNQAAHYFDEELAEWWKTVQNAELVSKDKNLGTLGRVLGRVYTGAKFDRIRGKLPQIVDNTWYTLVGRIDPYNDHVDLELTR